MCPIQELLIEVVSERLTYCSFIEPTPLLLGACR